MSTSQQPKSKNVGKIKKLRKLYYKHFFKITLLALLVVVGIILTFLHLSGVSLQPDMDFASNTVASFSGAIGGSLTLLAIEWYRSRLKTLADFNAAIAMFSNFINQYLNLKSQRVLPTKDNFYQEYNAYHSLVNLKKGGFITPPGATFIIQIQTNKISLPTPHFDVPLDRIFSQDSFHPQWIQILLQAKISILDAKAVCDEWDSLINYAQDLKQREKIELFLGFRKENGTQTTVFKDTIDNLVVRVDDALWFSELTIQNLRKVAINALPFWLKGRVGTAVINEEHKSLMPPLNYKDGWLEPLEQNEGN